jgi:hypothetical protein
VRRKVELVPQRQAPADAVLPAALLVQEDSCRHLAVPHDVLRHLHRSLAACCGHGVGPALALPLKWRVSPHLAAGGQVAERDRFSSSVTCVDGQSLAL